MTELEKIAYTKEFIDKLANGINPLDDTPIPDGDIMNNVRLSRCMFYVSDILRRVMENGGVERKKIERIPFFITPEQLARYEFGTNSISASEIARKIYALADNTAMKKLGYRAITSWLTEAGMLYRVENSQGKSRLLPTEEGLRLGIARERKMGQYGEYESVVYNRAAQQFILDNMDAIIALKNAEK